MTYENQGLLTNLLCEFGPQSSIFELSLTIRDMFFHSHLYEHLVASAPDLVIQNKMLELN